MAIWLARILGSEGYGIYAFATAVVAVLFAISGLGFGGVLLRQTALYRTIGRIAHTAKDLNCFVHDIIQNL